MNYKTFFSLAKGFNKKLLFYRIPKNASTSIYNHISGFNIIHERFDDILKNADQQIYYNWFCPSHSTPKELYKTLGNEMENCIRFAVVRNPWDRMVSMYNQNRKIKSYKVLGYKPNMTFKEFCELAYQNKSNEKFIASIPQIEWTHTKYQPHDILKFETLQDDFCKMIEKYKINYISSKLPHENKTHHAHFSEYYDLQSKEMIGDLFKEDIKIFKYSFPEDVDFSKPKAPQGFLRI